MFLTPVCYPFYIVGGGLNGSTGVIQGARYIHLLGHALNLGAIFKANPMADAVLVFQSFLYNGALPSSSHLQRFSIPAAVPAAVVKHGRQVVTIPAHIAVQHITVLIQSNVSWFDFGYLVLWAAAAVAIGLKVFRKYEARLPEEL
jgi:hypothetical protein